MQRMLPVHQARAVSGTLNYTALRQYRDIRRVAARRIASQDTLGGVSHDAMHALAARLSTDAMRDFANAAGDAILMPLDEAAAVDLSGRGEHTGAVAPITTPDGGLCMDNLGARASARARADARTAVFEDSVWGREDFEDEASLAALNARFAGDSPKNSATAALRFAGAREMHKFAADAAAAQIPRPPPQPGEPPPPPPFDPQAAYEEIRRKQMEGYLNMCCDRCAARTCASAPRTHSRETHAPERAPAVRAK